MSITISPADLPSLGAHQRDEAGRELQATLVELIDLELAGKQFHWSVVGPHFRSLHLQLDEMVDSWRGLSDTVAERAVAIGYWPDGQARTVADSSRALSSERGPLEDHEVVRQLTRRLAETSERVRTRMDRVEDIDAASQDVLVEVLRGIEESLWMMRAQLSDSERG